MSDAQTFPGWDGIAPADAQCVGQAAQPHYSAERIAEKSPDRYALAVRLIFRERMPHRAICRLLGMSPNSLAAIERREMRLNPAKVDEMRSEERIEAAQLRRMCREEIRARFLDETAMQDTSLKELTSLLKTLNDMDAERTATAEPNRNAEEGNDYVTVVAEWQDGFTAEENSAGGSPRGEPVSRESTTEGADDGASDAAGGGNASVRAAEDADPTAGGAVGTQSELAAGTQSEADARDAEDGRNGRGSKAFALSHSVGNGDI